MSKCESKTTSEYAEEVECTLDAGHQDWHRGMKTLNGIEWSVTWLQWHDGWHFTQLTEHAEA